MKSSLGEKLFRDEAMRAQSLRSLGAARLATRTNFTIASAVAVVCMVAIFAYACIGEFSRKERLSGYLEPIGGTISVSPSMNGTLLKIFKSEGEYVKEKEPIAVIGLDLRSDSNSRWEEQNLLIIRKIATTEKEVLLRKEQYNQRRMEIASRIELLEQEAKQAAREREIAEQSLSLSKKKQDRAERLVGLGFISPSSTDDINIERLAAESRVEASRRLEMNAKRDISILQIQLNSEKMQADADQLALIKSKYALQQEQGENDLRKSITVVAPKSGILSSIGASSGSQVTTNKPLFLIIPQDGPTNDKALPSMRARLFAKSRAIGFIRAGNNVYIKLDAYPNAKFGAIKGKVTGVTSTTLDGSDASSISTQNIQGDLSSADSYYRVDVKLESQHINIHGTNQPLKAGMRIEADVILERRKIWEWIFEPLISTGRDITH
jgi:membrane fusion protein